MMTSAATADLCSATIACDDDLRGGDVPMTLLQRQRPLPQQSEATVMCPRQRGGGGDLPQRGLPLQVTVTSLRDGDLCDANLLQWP